MDIKLIENIINEERWKNLKSCNVCINIRWKQKKEIWRWWNQTSLIQIKIWITIQWISITDY